MSEDIQYQIDGLSSDLVVMLAETYHWDTKRALDEYYASETFRRLCMPETGLYFQSPVYVFNFLQNEIEKGVLA